MLFNKRSKSLITFVLVAVLCFLHSSAKSQTNVHSFADDEFITDWLICGPFPSDEEENINTDFLLSDGGETKVIPEAGKNYSSNSVEGKVTWHFAKAEESGKLNFRELIEPNQKNVVYAATVINCDNAQPVIFKFGSNDRLKVWLNGKLIHFYSQVRAGGPDTDQIPAGLKKGKNLLLAKVDNDGGNWWLYARYKKLTRVDDDLFVWGPDVNEAAKRVSENEIADLFNVMVFNASESVLGPVSFGVEKAEGRTEKSLRIEQLAPGDFEWLNLESPVKEDFLGKDLHAKVYVQTPSAKKVFPLSAKRKNIQNGKTYLVQGFHVDPVWRDDQSGYQALSFSNLSQFLKAGQVDPLFGIYLHEIPYLKAYYGEYAKARPIIREMIQTGQIETGGSYNQPNETSISGEGIIRNILYGRLYHENVLKDYPRVYTPWDVFGHVIQLPQILSKSEFIGTTWERGNYRSPFVRVPDIPDVYYAMSPDGSVVMNRKVMYSTQEFTGTNFHDLDLRARNLMAEKMQEQQTQIPGIEYNFFLDALDEKPPTPWYIGRSSELANFVPEVTTRPDGAEQYFLQVQQQEKRDNLDIPIVSRDESQYNEGCELSRFDLKMGNRLAENTIISAEKFGTIANLLGNSYPALELDKAWRQLLYGQHHDGITGCGADVPYLDLTEAYHEALELGNNALKASHNYIVGKVNTNGIAGVPIVVFNPLNWERNDLVSTVLNFDEPLKSFEIVDENGNKVETSIKILEKKDGKIASAQVRFMASNVPSVGYKTFRAVSSKDEIKATEQLNKNTFQIENEYFSITCDKNMGGGITSIIDKATGKEYIKSKTGHPGNELIQLKEGGGFEPAWRFLTTGEKRFSKDTECEIKVEESELGKKLIITGDMDRLKKRVQEITLYNGIQRIDFRTTLVDYTGMDGKNLIENDEAPRVNDRDLYCIGFPIDLDGAIPVFEDRFATKSYFKSKGYLDYYSTDVAWTSQHAMNSCNNWLDYSYSVKVDFGDAGSVAVGPSEIITSHNSSTRKLGFSLMQALAKKGVTATPSYDLVERGEDILYRHFSFSLGVKGENKYTNKLYAKLSSGQKKVVDKSLKENGFAVFFITDNEIEKAWFDLPVLAIIGKDEASLAKAVDSVIAQLEENSSVHLEANLCMTQLENPVPDFGMALLNKGNIAVSIENDGTMVLPLMHTVPWQSPLLSWTHDFPERKTHVFEYALVPHKGNWREAELVKKGMEFNNPLLACQTTIHDGSLPASHSFFSTENENVIISAIKPKTNGVESYSAKVATDAKNGVVVRVYEANGTSSDFAFQSSFPIQNAQKTNLMERQPSSVKYDVNRIEDAITSSSIETYLLALKAENLNSIQEITSKLPAKIYSSYWQHNSGAAPMGNLPVTIKILGDLKSFNENSGRMKVQSLEVAISNDYTDTAVEGTIKLSTPPGIRAVPTELEYKVSPDSEIILPFDIVIEGHGAEPGFVVASTELNGSEVFDAMEYILPEKRFGHNKQELKDEQKISWTSEQRGDEILVTLQNPFEQKIYGNVSLIGPVETWGMQEVNPASLMDVADWQQDFELKPNGSMELRFKLKNENILSSEDIAAWLVAKLTYFGYIDYKPAMGKLEIAEDPNGLSEN